MEFSRRYNIQTVYFDFHRRGFKAVFMLVPLFGLQLFLAIYRPPDGSPGDKEYEYVTFIVTNSQVNSEVGSILVQPRRRWAGIYPTLVQRLLFAG